MSRWTCPTCRAVFDDQGAMKDHAVMVHRDDDADVAAVPGPPGPPSCPECGYSISAIGGKRPVHKAGCSRPIERRKAERPPMPDQTAPVINWRHVADVLAEELARWGWGDFHYGAQPQEESVVTALAVYREAVERDA